MFIWQSSLRIDSESDSVFEPGGHCKENIKDTKAFLIALCVRNQSHANCEEHGLDNTHFCFPYLFPLWSKTWTQWPMQPLTVGHAHLNWHLHVRLLCARIHVSVSIHLCAQVGMCELPRALGAMASPVATRIYSRWQGIIQVLNHQMNNSQMERASSSKAYGPQALKTGHFCL